MRKIRYYYTSVSKQIFLLVLIFSMIVRFALFLEVKYMNISKYSNDYNAIASVTMFLFFIAICSFLLIAYHFFY